MAELHELLSTHPYATIEIPEEFYAWAQDNPNDNSAPAILLRQWHSLGSPATLGDAALVYFNQNVMPATDDLVAEKLEKWAEVIGTLYSYMDQVDSTQEAYTVSDESFDYSELENVEPPETTPYGEQLGKAKHRSGKREVTSMNRVAQEDIGFAIADRVRDTKDQREGEVKYVDPVRNGGDACFIDVLWDDGDNTQVRSSRLTLLQPDKQFKPIKASLQIISEDQNEEGKRVWEIASDDPDSLDPEAIQAFVRELGENASEIFHEPQPREGAGWLTWATLSPRKYAQAPADEALAQELNDMLASEVSAAQDQADFDVVGIDWTEPDRYTRTAFIQFIAYPEQGVETQGWATFTGQLDPQTVTWQTESNLAEGLDRAMNAPAIPEPGLSDEDDLILFTPEEQPAEDNFDDASFSLGPQASKSARPLRKKKKEEKRVVQDPYLEGTDEEALTGGTGTTRDVPTVPWSTPADADYTNAYEHVLSGGLVRGTHVQTPRGIGRVIGMDAEGDVRVKIGKLTHAFIPLDVKPVIQASPPTPVKGFAPGKRVGLRGSEATVKGTIVSKGDKLTIVWDTGEEDDLDQLNQAQIPLMVIDELPLEEVFEAELPLG